MRFVWDSEKDKINRAKHGLSLADSTELFKSGVDYLEIFDEGHSEHEDRFIAVGPIKRGVIVVACLAAHERANGHQERAATLRGM